MAEAESIVCSKLEMSGKVFYIFYGVKMLTLDYVSGCFKNMSNTLKTSITITDLSAEANVCKASIFLKHSFEGKLNNK